MTYTVTAEDSGTPVAAVCMPTSGSSFARGTTTVNCTADNGLGDPPASGSFDVKVFGPPVLSLPADIVVTEASNNVTFSATASDELGSVAVTCDPGSPHVFAVGTTVVNCSAARSDPVPGSPSSGSFSVTVTALDTTAPETTIASSVRALIATRSLSVSFSASEAGSTFACSLDGAAFAACNSPAALTDLADGVHTFRVRSTDPAGNTDATPAAATWTVDATPPVLSPVGSLDKVAEADGPGGTRVAFAVSGSDGGVALLAGTVTCAPASETRFPLGRTAVNCQAADEAGNLGLLRFDVTVRDTTAPSINAPDVSFTATDAEGIASTSPAVSAYLSGISAFDLVSTPTLTTNAPRTFPIGVTDFRVTAHDVAGNANSKIVTVTVLQPGAVTRDPDLTPPGRVAAARARAGDHRVELSWRPPPGVIARVEVRQSIVGEALPTRLAYSGLARSVTLKHLRNGETYRFVLVAFDAAGNSSRGVVVNASPRAFLLARPLPGARVTSPPLLRWAPVPSTYFNVQLYRGGVKVLSAWPAGTRFQLPRRWVYKGRKLQLRPAVYTWYVWPGLGARAEVRYGELLGKSSFVVASSGTGNKR